MARISALNQLERRLDSLPSRLLQRTASEWRAGWRQRPRGRSTRIDLAAVLGEPAPQVDSLEGALEHALRRGAYESAERLVERLLSGPVLVGRRLELALETLLMCGQRERAAALALAGRSDLSETAAGLALLELLGLGSGAFWLPDGSPHMLSLDRQIEDGRLAIDQLAELCARKPWAWLRWPELHLLFFNALRREDPERALGFLNRFMMVHELPGYRLRDRSAWSQSPLAAIETQKARGSRHGPLVSVIVPALNAARTIGYSVDSLLAQSYQTLEVLVCDDGSDDETLALLRARQKGEPRLRVFRSERRQGSYNLRNALVLRARGPLLTFHDADDLAVSTRLELQVQELRRQPQVVACVADLLRLDLEGRVAFFRDQRALRLCPVSLMLTREAFEAAGPFRGARVGADQELYRELQNRFGTGAVRRMRTPLVLGLWSSNSVTRQPGVEALADGYRSPARRAYSEQLYAKYEADALPSDERWRVTLRAHDNWLEPSEIVELPAS